MDVELMDRKIREEHAVLYWAGDWNCC